MNAIVGYNQPFDRVVTGTSGGLEDSLEAEGIADNFGPDDRAVIAREVVTNQGVRPTPQNVSSVMRAFDEGPSFLAEAILSTQVGQQLLRDKGLPGPEEIMSASRGMQGEGAVPVPRPKPVSEAPTQTSEEPPETRDLGAPPGFFPVVAPRRRDGAPSGRSPSAAGGRPLALSAPAARASDASPTPRLTTEHPRTGERALEPPRPVEGVGQGSRRAPVSQPRLLTDQTGRTPITTPATEAQIDDARRFTEQFQRNVVETPENIPIQSEDIFEQAERTPVRAQELPPEQVQPEGRVPGGNEPRLIGEGDRVVRVMPDGSTEDVDVERVNLGRNREVLLDSDGNVYDANGDFLNKLGQRIPSGSNRLNRLKRALRALL